MTKVMTGRLRVKSVVNTLFLKMCANGVYLLLSYVMLYLILNKIYFITVKPV